MYYFLLYVIKEQPFGSSFHHIIWYSGEWQEIEVTEGMNML